MELHTTYIIVNVLCILFLGTITHGASTLPPDTTSSSLGETTSETTTTTASTSGSLSTTSTTQPGTTPTTTTTTTTTTSAATTPVNVVATDVTNATATDTDDATDDVTNADTTTADNFGSTSDSTDQSITSASTTTTLPSSSTASTSDVTSAVTSSARPTMSHSTTMATKPPGTPPTTGSAKVTTSKTNVTTSGAKKTTMADKERNKADCEEKMFSGTGLWAFIGVVALCLLLMLILLGTILCCTSRNRNRKRREEDENSVPKLKMLEIRDTSSKPAAASEKRETKDDGLNTYSLDYDYEKHVQERIEEHKRKNKQQSSEPVSTFMIGKKASIMSTGSSSSTKTYSAPNSPAVPTEHTPLTAGDDDGDAQVFNFSRTPGESLVARRASNFEQNDRRPSNMSATKGVKVLSKCDEYDV